MFKNKKFKIAIPVVLLTISFIAFPLVNPFNSEIAQAENISLTKTIQNYDETKNSVTPENYKDALSNYIKRNPNKFDKNNPSSILTEFMNEYNLDYITVSN